MCSIIGYRGGGPAAPVLVKGLRRMEYRGYDSVGVATGGGGTVEVRKGVGRVDEVNRAEGLDGMAGSVGVGHTRWATHGGVTRANAHPHRSNSGRVAVVHNGIIENFAGLREGLERDGYEFASETDTEVIANLLQRNWGGGAGPREAMSRTLAELEGHYAFAAMFDDGTLAAARLREPLIIGVGDGAYFVSSDVLGFIEQTDEAIYMDNGDMAVIGPGGLQVCRFDGTPVERQVTKVSREFADAYKGDYAHFTLKEIFEQPGAVLRAGGDGAGIAEMAERIRSAGAAYITGSGTSYNAALVARHVLSATAGVRIEPVISSEMPHMPVAMGPGSVLVALSQSGESADVLAAAGIARDAGADVVSVVNSMTSSLARESSLVVGMGCGPEIGVAATKSFTSQLAAIHRIAGELAGGRGADLGAVSAGMSRALEGAGRAREVARLLRDVTDVYVLGRGVHYPIALEAALKLKELAYVHAEGIPGGELKHGPLALMGPDAHVIIINPSDSTYADTQTSAREIRARGARIIGVSDRDSDAYDHWMGIPRAADEAAYPMTEIVPVQLLSYYLALEKDADPDYPRNLAKSVTVR